MSDLENEAMFNIMCDALLADPSLVESLNNHDDPERTDHDNALVKFQWYVHTILSGACFEIWRTWSEEQMWIVD